MSLVVRDILEHTLRKHSYVGIWKRSQTNNVRIILKAI